MDNLNIFDTVTLVIIVLIGLKGLFRGFIKEAFALIGIVGGVFVASRLARDVGFFVDGFLKIDNESTILLVGFVLSIAIFWSLAYILGILVSKMFSVSGLGIFDRLMGILFGAGKIFLIFAIIFYSLSKVEAIKGKIEAKIGDSFMYPLFVEIGSKIIQLDTTAIVNKIENGIEQGTSAIKNAVIEEATKDVNITPQIKDNNGN